MLYPNILEPKFQICINYKATILGLWEASINKRVLLSFGACWKECPLFKLHLRQSGHSLVPVFPVAPMSLL